ncbi:MULTISPECIES: MucR family transcriptional regulator [Methylobacterium]|uniref:MucR family transcriptional regulator n=1 Tax=Methylobacterium TaxID=407 RepID=UPI0011CB67C1|nr:MULTISPECIES: MucR family transcriptional regulator [Methylobacterium]TXN47174.1 MucR family transcriptional regulator [Methylobacterium sp. WL7]TXN73370.1 MucR family transcriptional regulator [Methylobacterium sp. WL18]GJE20537.1 Transcriptional regulatory protein ros [Methylobacterium mesophilicum]
MLTTSPSVELAAKILSAYVTKNSVPAGALPSLLSEVHRSITALDAPSEQPVKRPTEAQIRASIRPDTIMSFEDGKSYKALRRHLTLRGLTPEAYKAKWGLPVDYPLVSAAYSARRSKISREIGLGQKLRMQQAAE